MLPIDENQSAPESLKRRLYRSIRERIINGLMPAGERLPSTRQLANQLGLSRTTICEAYDMLISEGFIENRPGRPARVAAGVCLGQKDTPAAGSGEDPVEKWVVDFQTGQPELRAFPLTTWEHLRRQSAANIEVDQLGYTGTRGLRRLREEISAWLFRSRGFQADPSDIFITAGATQSLHLRAEFLIDPGGRMVTEDPCHTGLLQTFLYRGFTICPALVDEQGLITDLIPPEKVTAIYVTPSHQFPLGGIMPAARRSALIRLARSTGACIIEDDYDSEFRYTGHPVAPLAALDQQQVIYVGTFSKTLFPALRIGYAVLPTRFHQTWITRRRFTDVRNPPFEQLTLAEFLHTRQMDKHIRKMRRLYSERRQTLLQALQEAFGNSWRPWGDAAGLHLAIQFPGRIFDAGFIQKTRQAGLRVNPVEDYCLQKGRHNNKLLVGYGHLESTQIQLGVSLLRQCLQA